MRVDTDAVTQHRRSPCEGGAKIHPAKLTCVVAGLIFTLLRSIGFAQGPVAATSLTLAIKDQTGAVIPGAFVEIASPAHETRVKMQSDIAGLIRIGIQPGEYNLAVTEQGFQSVHRPLSIASQPYQSEGVTLRIGMGGGPVAVASEPTPASSTGGSGMRDQPGVLQPRFEIKVVVVTMFEIGADTGDVPGEYQYWVEREHLTQVMPFPQGYHDLRLNPQTGVLGLLTGMGTARATASVMALGLDPRFDLTHAYWLVAGIAGIDPHAGSLGSAVWADYIVDGDLSHEIDAREIPSTWSTGHVPLRKSTPYEQPRTDDNGLAYHLNPSLTAWAFNLTKDTKLPDTAEIAERRKAFLPEDPASPAHRPPFVLRGDILSASNFWHGKLMSRWAEEWVAYQTDGKGHYAACGMEDTGTLESLTRLSHAGKIDLSRVMVLRTASNYDQQRQGITASDSLAETKITKYGAFLPSLDSAYRVGHQVVDALVASWPQTREHIPSTAKERQ